MKKILLLISIVSLYFISNQAFASITCNDLSWQVNNTGKMSYTTDAFGMYIGNNYEFRTPVWNNNTGKYDYTSVGTFTTLNNGEKHEVAPEDFRAFQNCEALGVGWRVPTEYELISLSQSSCKNNIGSLDANSYYWSGTISKNPQYALKVKLSDGSSDSDMKTKNLNVVCVKSEIPTTPTVCNNLAWKVNNHVQLPYTTEALAYKGNNYEFEKPIWNNDTGKYDYTAVGKSVTLDNGDKHVIVAEDYRAFQNCENLGVGWRLPTKQELIDLSGNSCKNDIKFFNPNGLYWSENIYVNSLYAIKVNLVDGTEDIETKAKSLDVVCVNTDTNIGGGNNGNGNGNGNPNGNNGNGNPNGNNGNGNPNGNNGNGNPNGNNGNGNPDGNNGNPNGNNGNPNGNNGNGKPTDIIP